MLTLLNGYAQRSYRSNTRQRIAATVDALTGRVVYHRRSQIRVKALVDVYQRVAQVYADRDTTCVLQDSWPIHVHPKVLAPMCPQPLKWPVHVPSHWPTAPSPRARHLDLPICQCARLQRPTYAPGTHPAETLWCWPKQTVLHFHRYADRWNALWRDIESFFPALLKPRPSCCATLAANPARICMVLLSQLPGRRFYCIVEPP